MVFSSPRPSSLRLQELYLFINSFPLMIRSLFLSLQLVRIDFCGISSIVENAEHEVH